MSSHKKQLGQFFTTNVNYILSEFKEEIVSNSSIYSGLTIVEPFAGNRDLINWLTNNSILDIFSTKELYDIQPKSGNIIYRDTLANPPVYEDKFVITNPPYLALNKSSK